MAICSFKHVYKNEIIDYNTTDDIFVWNRRQALYYNMSFNNHSKFIPIPVWNKLYRVELLEKELFPVGMCCEDIFFTTSILNKIKKCIYIKQAKYNYTIERKGKLTDENKTYKYIRDSNILYKMRINLMLDMNEKFLASIALKASLQNVFSSYYLLFNSKKSKEMIGMIRFLQKELRQLKKEFSKIEIGIEFNLKLIILEFNPFLLYYIVQLKKVIGKFIRPVKNVCKHIIVSILS